MNKLAERMQNLLRPFVLRRLKTEVANQLAPKKHKLHKLAMTDEQALLYAKAVADLRKDLAPDTGEKFGAPFCCMHFGQQSCIGYINSLDQLARCFDKLTSFLRSLLLSYTSLMKNRMTSRLLSCLNKAQYPLGAESILSSLHIFPASKVYPCCRQQGGRQRKATCEG